MMHLRKLSAGILIDDINKCLRHIVVLHIFICTIFLIAFVVVDSDFALKKVSLVILQYRNIVQELAVS